MADYVRGVNSQEKNVWPGAGHGYSVEIDLVEMEQEAHRKRNAAKRLENYGDGSMNSEGAKDRLEGRAPNVDLSLPSWKQNSYFGGYYRTGSLRLNAYLEQHKDELSDEQVGEYGRRDAINGVPRDALEPLLKNELYMKGFNIGIIERGEMDRLSFVQRKVFENGVSQKLYDVGYYERGNVAILKIMSQMSDEEKKEYGYRTFKTGIGREFIEALLRDNVFREGYEDAIVDDIMGIVSNAKPKSK